MRRLAALIVLFVFTNATEGEEPPIPPPDWQSSLRSELISLNRFWTVPGRTVDAGYIWIPATVPMVKIFETTPKAEVTTFLASLLSAEEPTGTKIDRSYLQMCMEAIRQNVAHSKPTEVKKLDQGGAVISRMTIVYYWLPLRIQQASTVGAAKAGENLPDRPSESTPEQPGRRPGLQPPGRY